MNKKILALAFGIIAIIVAANVFLLDNVTAGNQQSYDQAYNEGKTEGYIEGNQTGYNFGYEMGYLTGKAEGFIAGNSSGYQIGCDAGYLDGKNDGYVRGVNDGVGRGYTIRDPTYSEVLAFIESDQTQKNVHNESYTCYEFTRDVCNNAFDAGFRAGDVYIEFSDGAHALVCFDTVDKGLVFLEPQTDEVMTVEVGVQYWDRSIYQTPDFDDTIVKYGIIW